MSRDQLFIDLAFRAKFLTPLQLQEAKQLQGILAQNGFDFTLPEVLTKKEFLNADQVRVINIAIRYEETRREDEAFGAFISQKGFLSEEKVRECLAFQEQPYREGRHFARLHDILVQRNYLAAAQLHIILRAWQQLDTGRKRQLSAPLMPVAQAAMSGPASAPIPPVPAAPAKRKAVEDKLEIGMFRVSIRRTKLKAGSAGELQVHVLDLGGSLDGHTFHDFDGYLASVIDAQCSRIVLNCEKLEYISSAGIGVLAGAAKRCRDSKGDLRMCNVTEKVKKIVSLVGLHAMLKVYDNEKDAITSFKFA
jgi:anti-anti-sigma factor